MEQVRVERLAHLGLIASVMKDLGLIAMIDRRLVPDEQEVSAPGEAVAGMFLNGLGFANRPVSLTPQFFGDCSKDTGFIQPVPDGVRRGFVDGLRLGLHATYPGPTVH